MKILKTTMLLLGVLVVFLGYGDFIPTASAQDTTYANYIMVDISSNSKPQTLYVYNQGRLENEIYPDNSTIQYTYDRNGNLIKKSKGYSSTSHVFSSSALSYDIYLKGVSDSIQQVTFPTWTEQGGQDDLEWIAGERLTNGLWKGTVVLAKHGKETGQYNTHIYADGKAVSGLTATVQNNIRVISPQEVSLADRYYEIFVEGIASNVREIRFPTWTDYNWQDDLVNPWIIGEKVNETTWKIRIPFSNHNYETGSYITHIYAFDKYGNSGGIGGTSVNVKEGTGGSKETDISGVSYDVFIYGVDPKTQKVQFPTWTANKDQDDLEWIEGVKIANGVWKGTIVYSNHHSETGRYITHIYADGKYSGAWFFDVTNKTSITAPSIAYASNGFYDITIEGVPSSVTDVRFPTWTVSNGQDDLENPWIKGERLSATSWRIRIPFYKHNNETGTYVTHIYSYDAYMNRMMIGDISVEVKK
ncbi:GBS Bsp-like repeat-containing protein [Paenibacillus sp. FSL K6-2859]|uniref:GBS Bsp-like repeat-containing protein n=1 Tax=Paenibacillus sp. FSL K6-2859 TaxID=2921482 RepID=UPI0030F8CADF